MGQIDDVTAALRAAGLTEADLGRSLAETADALAGIAAAPPGPAGFAGLSLLAAPSGAESVLARLAADMAAGFEAMDGSPAETPARLAALRAELARQGIDGFIVPLNDEYNGEYVPRRARRLAWLTGFTGSAGVAVVLADTACVWSDGRYTLQLEQQIDPASFERRHVTDDPPATWLADRLKPGQKLGYDPWLHTTDGLARLREACARAGATLVAVEPNPVDMVWAGQPPPPLSPVEILPIEIAGEAAADKRRRIAASLAKDGAEATVLTLPESIAWLLNIRGADVPHTPLPLGFAVLRADASVELFIDPRKVSGEVRSYLGNEVTVRPIGEFGDALARLGQGKAKVRLDNSVAASWVVDRLQSAGAALRFAPDPCLLPKACKNPVELDGIRAAHRRDGVAVTRFLAWLAQEAPKGTVDELIASDRLYAFRLQGEKIRDLSFPTISGAGPNGAIVHYRSTPATNRKLGAGELYLVDSGAQYLDGTTDITRTVAIGTPSQEMRDRFTRVLKGHIALATTIFPVGTSGSQLDTLARHALWQVGLDYDHGTGHGVGHYLSVHEGPQRISKVPNTIALQPGMVVSNEPGYYKTGGFGIRIENLVAVREVDAPSGAERKMLGFETLTRAPIDRAPIDPELLTAAEIAWLDAYHAEVRLALTPLLDPAAAAWLADATRPLL
ncbi:aminopeptidase P family protein [Desertibaculum subflavum]|uniref:aminopeptidase P family protein n=1 Tax=Desertibaculum subflavum TaxID=2268458 RepID=UPI000E665CB0